MNEITVDKFNPESAFSQFEEMSERLYQKQWFIAAYDALHAPTGLSNIDAPPAVFAVIQGDGYKKWIDNPEYPEGKRIADERSYEIKKIRRERFHRMEAILLSYLKFILRCVAFRTLNVSLFESTDQIQDVLRRRCRSHWEECNHANAEPCIYVDLDFNGWISEFFYEIDFSDFIAENAGVEQSPPSSYEIFKQASDAARYISITAGLETVVERSNTGWVVIVQRTLSAIAKSKAIKDEGLDTPDCDERIFYACDYDDDDLEEGELFHQYGNTEYKRQLGEFRKQALEEINDFDEGLDLTDPDG